ncbi:hypothetical protein [Saccharicrinis fermentans]|uniref:Peptidyl-prolyl cis-trans isomerase n=1 Tax=Saccharicrinis fermentans DSM 9555 = JCM 21142 TaxID=869213 RepID=W7Y9X9_9BACT|nr:hypothetical protein [Saccharicrinis fermentans]GAF05122.1 hypothetical protein JCM21142_93846 [Saccharicrinis fermentans DSM 9555 = JCM 21142]
MKNSIILYTLVFALFLHSCKNVSLEEDSVPLAKVDRQVLTVKDLQKAIPDNLSENDSVAFSQNYINRWVKSSLLLRKAELNLTPKEKDVTQLLDDYRASLLIHRYQQKLLLQKYVPLITSNEIEEYYNQMSENFKLDKDIIVGIFIQVPLNAPNLKKLKKWYRSDEPEDYIKLEEYCFQNAQKFDNFMDRWVTLDEINKLLPKPLPKHPMFLDYNKFYETSDSTSHYLLSIRDFHKVDEIAPVTFVEDKIKAILLNKKRIEFIQNLEEELYNEGLEQKVVKFY